MRALTAGCCAWLCFAGILAADDTPPGKSITLEVIVAEAPEGAATAQTAAAVLELEKAGKLTFFARYRLTGLENQPASVKFTELTPLISGWTVSSGGRSFPSYRSVSIGTSLTAISRVEGEGAILTDLKIERSALSPAEPPDPADLKAKFQGVVTFSVDATVRSKPGEPLLVGGRQQRSGKEVIQTWVVLTSSVAAAPPAANKAAQLAPPQPEIKSYHLKHTAGKETAILLQQIFAGQPLTVASYQRPIRPVLINVQP